MVEVLHIGTKSWRVRCDILRHAVFYFTSRSFWTRNVALMSKREGVCTHTVVLLQVPEPVYIRLTNVSTNIYQYWNSSINSTLASKTIQTLTSRVHHLRIIICVTSFSGRNHVKLLFIMIYSDIFWRQFGLFDRTFSNCFMFIYLEL